MTVPDRDAARRDETLELADVIARAAGIITDAADRLGHLITADVSYGRRDPATQADLWSAVLALETATGTVFHTAKRSVGYTVATGHPITTSDGTRTFRLVGPPRAFGPIQIGEVSP